MTYMYSKFYILLRIQVILTSSITRECVYKNYLHRKGMEELVECRKTFLKFFIDFERLTKRRREVSLSLVFSTGLDCKLAVFAVCLEISLHTTL